MSSMLALLIECFDPADEAVVLLCDYLLMIIDSITEKTMYYQSTSFYKTSHKSIPLVLLSVVKYSPYITTGSLGKSIELI